MATAVKVSEQRLIVSGLEFMFILLDVVENDKLGQSLGDVVHGVRQPGATLLLVATTTLQFKLSQLLEKTQIWIDH